MGRASKNLHHNMINGNGKVTNPMPILNSQKGLKNITPSMPKVKTGRININERINK